MFPKRGICGCEDTNTLLAEMLRRCSFTVWIAFGYTDGLLAKIIHKNLFYISYTLNKAQQWILTSINCALSFYIMRNLCIDCSHFHRIFHTKYIRIQSLLCSCTCSICFQYLRLLMWFLM